MKKLISFKLAGHILITFLSLLCIFHLLILFQILPSNIVWGGKLEGISQVVLMELIALFVTIIFLFTIVLKITKTAKFRKTINIGVWVIFIYFSLNILGNLAAESVIEKAILSPIALGAALLTLRLAIEKKPKSIV